MKRLLAGACCALALALGACRTARADELLVFAATSLTDALEELGRAWEARSKDHVTFAFGASSELARQMKAGAPADVFFSADAARMEEVEAAGLVDRDERRDVLSNVLVVVVPKGSSARIGAARDLTNVAKLALANPDSVPAGVYAKKYLESQGVWDAIADHVIPTSDVRAALAAVASENVDAGIVYRTDAATSDRVRVALEVGRRDGPSIVYPVAPLKSSGKAGTRGFVRFLASRDAAPVYERFGFIVLPPK